MLSPEEFYEEWRVHNHSFGDEKGQVLSFYDDYRKYFCSLSFNSFGEDRLPEKILWKGEVCRITGQMDGPICTIEINQNRDCPHCKKPTNKEVIIVNTESHYFQQNATPIIDDAKID